MSLEFKGRIARIGIEETTRIQLILEYFRGISFTFNALSNLGISNAIYPKLTISNLMWYS